MAEAVAGYQLRDYQQEAVETALRSFRKGHPFVIQAATAAGKSLIIAAIAHRLGQPLLVLQPSREILLQNYEKMITYGIPDVAKYSASVGEKHVGNITLATIQSIYKKPELFHHFRYAIIDEADKVAPKQMHSMYLKFFRAINCTQVAGLTATPFRLENKFIRGKDGINRYTGCCQMVNRISRQPFFKSIDYKIEMKDLIGQGYLTQPRYHTIDTDMSGLVVNTTGRDYTEASLEQWSRDKLANLEKIAPELNTRHQRVLVFCSSLRQAGRAVQLLNSFGMEAAVLDGKTPTKQRQAIIERYQRGDLRWLVNVGVLGVGFDCPALDALVTLRPTFSITLYIQQIGRALRLDPRNPDKQAHVYDFSGNVNKFGPAEDIRLSKEDGFKDMLWNGTRRLDNIELFSFDLKQKSPTVASRSAATNDNPGEVTLDYLLGKV
jgi:DNA repair protein RadD